jgi:hypothetical protein
MKKYVSSFVPDESLESFVNRLISNLSALSSCCKLMSGQIVIFFKQVEQVKDHSVDH